jgi:hypothetical protein
MRIRNIFKGWFKKQSVSSIHFDKVEFVSSLTEVPKELNSTAIYIVQSGKNRKWVVFKCPDNCGNRVEVNLMKSKKPFWKLKIKRNKISLSPSVIVKGCNSHFWLIDNEVHWSGF